MCAWIFPDLRSIPFLTQTFSWGEASPDPGGLPYRWLLKEIRFHFIAIQLLVLGLPISIPGKPL